MPHVVWHRFRLLFWMAWLVVCVYRVCDRTSEAAAIAIFALPAIIIAMPAIIAIIATAIANATTIVAAIIATAIAASLCLKHTADFAAL